MIYDICIIGGGPGGYSAAVRGAQLGARVALVEKEHLGGTCLNHGCIPTKNLYTASELLRKLGEARNFGIKAEGIDFDYLEVLDRKNDVVEHLRRGLYRLMNEHKIDLFSGRGSLEGIGKIRIETPVGASLIETKKVIIATGSEAADLPVMRMDGRYVVGNREILNLPVKPSSLIIVGGGAIGCEFANIFSRLGTKVTIVEMMDRILPNCEKEISRLVGKRFEERGIEVVTGCSVTSGEVTEKRVKVSLSNGDEMEADRVLMSVGRRPNSSDLGLEDVGVTVKEGFINVSDRMETSIKGIYAVGDVTGGALLAHVAAQEGKVAAENAMGYDKAMDYSVIPTAVYIHPEVASVGRGEEDLKRAGIRYRTGRFPYIANGKAVAMREEDGFVKILASEDDGTILGAHILGTHASDLIAEAALAMKSGCTMTDIAETIHAHPTLSEAFQEAWEDTEGMAIHKVGKRKI